MTMSGLLSLALLICDVDNSLTDCLCGIISTHLMAVELLSDGFSPTGSGWLTDGTGRGWLTDGTGRGWLTNGTGRGWLTDGLWPTDGRSEVRKFDNP